ncbi:putative N-acetyl-gamma-glutamyl-phosphate chloroplastic-like, partial [Trifolium pratense]
GKKSLLFPPASAARAVAVNCYLRRRLQLLLYCRRRYKMSVAAFSSICFNSAHCSNKDLIKQHNVKSHIKCSIKSGITTTTSQNNVRVGVLGASGYTGSEIILEHD